MSVTWEVEHLPTSVLRIAFSGRGGIGSEGNDDGGDMSLAVREAFAAHDPAGLMIDLRAFEYEFGNWIGGAPLRAHRELGWNRVCMLATGATATALRSLWECGLDQMIPIFEDPDEAMRWLSRPGAEPP